MDFRYWSSVIKDWANALSLVENEIKEIRELESTGFFCKLIGYLQSDNISNMYKPGSDMENIANFIKDSYPHYNMKNENEWDDKELINIATLLLISSSLYASNSDIKNRSCSLPNITQTALCNVLELFVECQPHLITRPMIVDAINQGSSPSSPSKSLSSPAYYSNSPKSLCESPFVRQSKELQNKEREIKRLKIKLELVSSEKTDLENELILAKDSVISLKEEINNKEIKIRKLQGEMNADDDSVDTIKRQPSLDERYKELECKYKDVIDSNEVEMSTLIEEIKKLQKEKRDLNNKLTCSEKNVSTAAKKLELLQEENLDLINKYSNLEKYIAELTITCKEQADIISETKNAHCVPSNDSDTSIGNCESLASQVIDLQLREMEEKFQAKCSEVTEKQKCVDELELKVTNMLQTIETLNKDISCLQVEIKNHISAAESVKSACIEFLTQFQQLSHDMPERTGPIDDLVDTINFIKTSFISTYTSELMKKDEIISELKNTVQCLENNLITKNDVIANLEKENENHKVTIRKLKSNIKEANILASARVNDKAKLQQSVKTLTIAKDNLEKELSTLTDSLNSKIQHIENIEAQLANSNEAVLKLRSENAELQKDVRVCKNEYENLKAQLSLKIEETEQLKRHGPDIEQLKKECSQKLYKLKAIMKKEYNEHLSGVVENHRKEMSLYKEKLQRSQRQEHELKTCLAENQSLKRELKKLTTELSQMKNKLKIPEVTYTSSPLSKSRSMEQIGFPHHFTDINISVIQPVNEPFSSMSCLNDRQKNLPSELESDADDVFDNRHLADLKAGICQMPEQLDRLSVLQYRNSLCPPHLKSSYPLETQSYDPSSYREDTIRGREKSELDQLKRQSRSVKNNTSRPYFNSELPSHDRLRVLFK